MSILCIINIFNLYLGNLILIKIDNNKLLLYLMGFIIFLFLSVWHAQDADGTRYKVFEQFYYMYTENYDCLKRKTI